MTTKPPKPSPVSAGASLADAFGGWLKNPLGFAPASKKPIQMNSGGSFFPTFGGAVPATKKSGGPAAALLPSPTQKAAPENITRDSKGNIIGQGADYLLPSPTFKQPTFLDTLSKYEQEAKSLGLGGGDGTNYDALINTLNQNGAQGAAKLQAIYNQLGNSVAGDAPGIQSNFANAGSALAASTAQASKADANAYNATQAAQAAQFAALGIPNASAVLASNGAQAARDQNLAQSQLQLANAGNQAANTEHGANAIQYNTGVKEAVGQQGAQAQSALQQQLASKLAEIEQARAASKNAGATELFSAAQTLQGLDPNSPQYKAKIAATSTSNDLSNQLKASQIALNYAKASGSQKTITDALTGNLQATAAAQKFFVANGGNASDSKAFNQFLQNAKLAGSLSKK
jgi:hypothetical protein